MNMPALPLKSAILYILCLVASPLVQAQWQGKVYESFQDAAVTASGNPILSPWCGGINSVQINHADINNDGKNDLVLYDQNNDLIKTFINTGSSGQMKYTYDPMYAANFPYIHNYMLLRDYNCDGVPDLYQKGLYGVAVWKGYYQNNELKFTFFKDLFFPGTNGPVNVYVQPGDIPTIADMDNDGDLDIMSFEVLGAQLIYYKNMRVEDGLPCDSIKMVEFDNCWGKFFQNINRTVVTGVSCKGIAASNKKSRHTGNCILHIDMEGDGDLDFVGGNVSFNDAQVLYNNGSDIVLVQDSTYNHNGHILQMPSWPSPFHIDIDNDGEKDLLFSSHNDNLTSANYNAVAWYKNYGTSTAPNYIYEHDSLLTPDMIDVGTYSYPTFFDYDKDGKKDLFIGTEGYLDNNTLVQKAKLAYYKNTSVSGTVSFELITKDFLNLSSKNYKGIFPTFGDATGDGIDDLVLGNVDGYIALYKNFATANTLTPNFMWSTDSIPGIDVGKYSTPVVFDFDQDGKTDLLIGNQLGKLAYYRDTSSTSQKKLSLLTVSLGNFLAGATGSFYGYCAPFIGKMDNTGKDFLLIGNIDGTIARYDTFINNYNDFSRIDSNYSLIQVPNRSVPAVADLDGDGKYEMVVGNKMGGLHYYKQVLNMDVSVRNVEPTAYKVDYYPNPTDDILYLRFVNDPGKVNAQLTLADLSGRVLRSETFAASHIHSFDVKGMAPGVYIARLHIGGQVISQKVIKK
ncbi:MAG: T9SS type A sorting domain-containing protein [Chitinophagaceae bacterium]|nr:T9SS type A sorting domain-containing protein [Chitinophagaceae bacterium]